MYTMDIITKGQILQNHTGATAANCPRDPQNDRSPPNELPQSGGSLLSLCQHKAHNNKEKIFPALNPL